MRTSVAAVLVCWIIGAATWLAFAVTTPSSPVGEQQPLYRTVIRLPLPRALSLRCRAHPQQQLCRAVPITAADVLADHWRADAQYPDHSAA